MIRCHEKKSTQNHTFLWPEEPLNIGVILVSRQTQRVRDEV